MRERSSFEREIEALAGVEYDFPPPGDGPRKTTGPSVEGKGKDAKTVPAKGTDTKSKSGLSDAERKKLKAKKKNPVRNVSPTATGSVSEDSDKKKAS